MKTLLELAFEKHNDWISIVKSFGCNPSSAEDIVQEMYIQLHHDTMKGLDFSYKDDINHYYCFKILRGIYCNIYKKESKKIKMYLEDINELRQAEELGIDEIEYAKRKSKIDDILNNMYWYDKKVFEIVASGKSIASLSRETDISYYSLYNTYTNAKKHIKDNI
jgi:DNA-directed RNA polymerase specialized sigma24 family protein